MRVIAGTAGSIELVFPRGAVVRPTTDAMREALFSSLGERVEGAGFCDLYAGAGTVGIEALSRGAELCVFLEQDRRCVEALRENLRRTGLAEAAVILHGPAERTWEPAWREHGPFDMVFADPPYGLASFEPLQERLVNPGEGVAAGGLVVVQCDRRFPRPGRVETRLRRYGETEMRMYEHEGGEPPSTAGEDYA
jgi:16S rRNA (guanine(966)-N(2))-methyltransferase RsmD